MALFEYQCLRCGYLFERWVTGAKNKKIKCPKCNSSNVKKKISSFSTLGSKERTEVDKCSSCKIKKCESCS